MRWTLVGLMSVVLVAGCRPANPTPDQIRQDTAKATQNAVQDAKAVTQGVVDGLKQSRPVNINKASADTLNSLPGIDETHAMRIIASRPYDQPDDLVKKHVITQAQFDRISGRVTAH